MSEPRHFEKRWHAYWSGLKDPQYAQETEEHYRRYSVELRLLLDGVPTNRVLEIGCGNGALHPYLGFDGAQRYLGVGFSETMLQEFRRRFPTADVIRADGARSGRTSASTWCSPARWPSTGTGRHWRSTSRTPCPCCPRTAFS